MDKKKIVLTTIVIMLIMFLAFLVFMLLNKYKLKNNFEKSILAFANKNENTIFKIDNVVLFSNCDAKNKTASASNFTIENLYQYTDMAIFITNTSGGNYTMENTFKKVYINNIKYNTSPQFGEQKLYFKSINNFAKSYIIEENLINNQLDFNITSEDTANLDTPTLYNNLANPIVLSYVNSNIKTDYTITDTSSPITYDGSLLKKCGIELNQISCNLSFDIYITNNLDQEFKTTIFVDIPLHTEEKSIYDGNITLKQATNNTFYRYK